MSVTAAIRDLLAAGFTMEQALKAAEIMEAAMPAGGDVNRTARQERNRRYYVSKRLKASYSDDQDANSDDVEIPLQKKSPQTPKENYPLSSDPTGLRCLSARKHAWPDDFAEQVWSAYPRKTEKKAGIEALTRIHRADRVAWADLVSGIEGLGDSDPQFVPALARWLKGERWKDERPQSRPPPHRQAKRNTALDGLDELERRYSANVQQPSFLRIAG